MAAPQLTERNRRVLISLAAIEAALKVVMLADLRGRSDLEVRGSRRIWMWSTVVNSAGLIPIAYFLFGRRKRSFA